MFDHALLSQRDRRADKLGRVSFLHDRSAEDILERLTTIGRRFRRALLVGSIASHWPERLGSATGATIEPGGIDAKLEVASYDLCIILGSLDTTSDLPLALSIVRAAMTADALLIGAVIGGDTLPVLRTAMRAADEVMGGAAPHVHPRLEASALGPLLSSAGFVMPVVDVDRVQVAYSSLSRLVADLRGMAATNILHDRPRKPLTRAALSAAEAAFDAAGSDGRTVERFEILHFAAWTPAQG